MNQMAGYGLSMLLLAIASLILIPALIRAGGPQAWGSIAVGQAAGGVAAVVVGYGWQISGPARIAVADEFSRRTEYAESLIVRSVLYVPVAALAAAVSMLATPGPIWLAAAGAVSASAIGLRGNWYFVGIRRPYVLLLTETVPRVLGTLAGVLALGFGAPVLAGLGLQFAGSIVACLVAAIWILGGHRGEQRRLRSVREVLLEQRHGFASTLTSAVYVAAPTIIVSLVAPTVQPLYALVDKVQRQVSVGLTPAVTVAQGWVPNSDPRRRRRNAMLALGAGAVFAAACTAVVMIAGPLMIELLGSGSMSTGFAVIALMAVFVGANLYESIIARAVLAALDQLRAVARATLITSIAGLAGVAVGAIIAGVFGALLAVTCGLLIRMIIELIIAGRALRRLPGSTGAVAAPAVETPAPGSHPAERSHA